MPRDPRVDAYIEKQADFARPILTHIRALMHLSLIHISEPTRH